ncbi:hypothetical protein WCQ02_31040 [Paraburkholderia tropica]|uniref:hypothetical protein n=1 Tax=Paraburkholderia tropica TaxID=92647 RepID=UPI00301B0D0D
MNLNNIVSPIVAAINDWVSVSIQPSEGYTTNPDGSRGPKYGASIEMFAQIQPLLYRDLVQIDGLNLNGEKRAMYVNGDYQAIVRSSKEGGDLVTIQDGSVWLVVQQLENWSMEGGWVKVAIVKQNGS